MRSLFVIALLFAPAALAEEKYSSLDIDSVWVDARLMGSFAAGTGGRPAIALVEPEPNNIFRAEYGYQRGSIGFEIDAHLPQLGFGSSIHVAPTPMFRLQFTFGGADQVAPLPELTSLQVGEETGGLGYVVAVGNGVQVLRLKAFVLTGYIMVGLDGRRRWYLGESFLWAAPTVLFGARALYEDQRFRVRAGYEVQPPFFGRVEHRLEVMFGIRPFDDGVGPFFGLRLFGHYGQTPIYEGRGTPATQGMSELQGGIGVEVGL